MISPSKKRNVALQSTLRMHWIFDNESLTLYQTCTGSSVKRPEIKKMHSWLTILIHQGVGLLYLSDDFDEFGTGIFALGIIFRTNYDQTTLNKWARPGKCPSRPSSLSLPQHEFHSWQAAKCYKNIKHFALKWIRPNKPLGKTSFHSQMIKVTQAGRAWKYQFVCKWKVHIPSIPSIVVFVIHFQSCNTEAPGGTWFVNQLPPGATSRAFSRFLRRMALHVSLGLTARADSHSHVHLELSRGQTSIHIGSFQNLQTRKLIHVMY